MNEFVEDLFLSFQSLVDQRNAAKSVASPFYCLVIVTALPGL